MESIFVRVQRVLSSNVEVAVDAAERVSSGSLMREAVRQVERAEDETRSALEAARARRLQAERQQQSIRERIATLGEQARFALSKDRPDLAETAVARELDYEAQAKQLKAAGKDAAEEAQRLEECLAALKLRKAQMEKELAAFRAARREAPFPGAAPSQAERAERKAAQAETLFERAMSAAGNPGAGLMEPKEAAKLAEVDALQREAAIADRLAALKAAQAKGAKQAKRR